ncbi:RIP metalloprotease RseP [Legionella nagasakiensis]|uniref:RIP metalloprotease RseP n=1 Tax=Legionella nagasakiensis TaxID=535290 RepID=UPI001054DFA4|nr:RIP metalloprotease RseP [Legionella nagasakiensis]
MLFTLFYFFIALLLLIIIHEFGHFIVARCCGVKVLRFSFGFGKVLASWRDNKGTEFAWSILPLGGYVKMLDESEGEVPEHERHLAFNNQSVWVRIAIVCAGPLFNFLFAFVALWLMWVIGIKSLAPIVADVKPGSIAAQAGLQPNQEILQMAGKKINSWRDFQYALMPLLGTHEPIILTVKSLNDGHTETLTLRLTDWQLNVKNPDILANIGMIPFVPTIPPVIGAVMTDSPAQSAGLRVGDEILAINDKPINDWLVLVDYVKQHPDEHITLAIKRNNEINQIETDLGHVTHDGQNQGLLGVSSKKISWPKHWLRLHRAAPLPAAGYAFSQTIELTGATFALIGRLITGKLPIQSISGPVGIAQGAGESARSGFSYYLSFLALVSISLGVLNLLPIPVLDGGHLFYCFVEIVRRRPLSEGVKSAGIYLGFLLLITLMIVALSNDLARLTG